VIEEPLPLYKIIEYHALNQPNAISAICEKAELTYAQLNRQANSLAHVLLAKKIVPGSAVAVFINPSTNILVSILAIHKIGGVYVPVDPGFPLARVSAILNEVDPLAILIDEHTGGIPPEYLSICYKLNNINSHRDTENIPEITVAPGDISHIYFTSGTTGKPKGVLATHQNLIHYVSSAINRYGFNKDDIFLAGARFTFSISMFELMVPLVAGGRVRILPREILLDLNQLSRAVASATVFHFGPSLLKQLLPYIEEHYRSFEPFEQHTHVSSGGDMVPPEILEKLKKIFRNAGVFVIYGSSEISCMGCTYEVSRSSTISRTLVGGPFENVQVKILDSNGKMVPAGVQGQIYFSGLGLVKGYLNLPELTQEKFTLIDGERFYAIGDIGRYDQDGNIQLLGREDFQVQIRGMRIELLEIEACLKNFPTIADCVVVGRPLQEGEEKSLVAYLVFHQDKMTVADNLKRFVADQLPDYMVPAAFVKLDKLPTNHNAKLDRSQLPAPNIENILVSAKYETASTDVEAELITIWENLFNIEHIGIDHNFFELGGDSLLAVSFLLEVEKKLGKLLPISILINSPTIRDIAQIVTSKAFIEGMGDIAVLRKGNSEPPLFCMDGVLIYKELAQSLNTERMVCGVYLEDESTIKRKGRDSAEYKVFSSVKNLAARFLKSIRAFQPNGPYYLCGHSFGGIIALEVARILQEEGEKIQLVALFDSYAPGYALVPEYLKRRSLINRIATHLNQIKQLGWPHLKQLIARHTKRISPSISAGNQPDSESGWVTELRDRAYKKYHPEPYHGEVILFRVQDNSEHKSASDDLGWRKYIQKLEVHEASGGHWIMLAQGHVERISNILADKMKRG